MYQYIIIVNYLFIIICAVSPILFCKSLYRDFVVNYHYLSICVFFISGVLCHYFTLCLSFWSTCFILNTYLVVVKGTRKIFESAVLIHLIQSLLCWVGPAIIVVICIYVKYPSPAYKISFVDFMTASPCGELLTYLAVTLPMQVTLGTSLCLLWSITWCIRRVSL